jgi:hypothetical protein
MDTPENSDLTRRFEELYSSEYGRNKVDLLSSDVSPRNKALCFVCGAALTALTTLGVARAHWHSDVLVVTTAIVFGYFVWRKR